MNKKTIKKKVVRYTILKNILVIALLGATLTFVISALFFAGQIISIISYIFMLVIIILTYLFPINCKLSKSPRVKDFQGILEYLVDISDSMSRQRYFESLVMIKNSLDEIAHYQMQNEEQYIKDSIYYLQGQFHSGNSKQGIPNKLYNRSYIRNLCNELETQLNKKTFDANKLENIAYDSSYSYKRKKIHITLQGFCNFILIGLVIGKIVITVNADLYNQMNYNAIIRVIYNIGADIIAVALGIAALLHSNK